MSGEGGSSLGSAMKHMACDGGTALPVPAICWAKGGLGEMPSKHSHSPAGSTQKGAMCLEGTDVSLR